MVLKPGTWRNSSFAPLVAVWIVLAGLLAMRLGPGFLSADNLGLIARQTAIVGFAAIGMTLIIVSGLIDLSVGSVVALVTVAMALGLRQGLAPELAIVAGLLVGGLAGTLNGLLTTRLRVSAFIVTLGSLLVWRGVAKGLANEQKIDAPITWLVELLARLTPEKRWMLVPPGVWALFAFGALAHVLLTRSRLGRHFVAVGSNERAALYSGVEPARVRLAAFSIAGVCFGLAGVMQFARLTVGDPTVAFGLELDVIAAVVIGGASLSGGQGSIGGSLLGAFLMATIRSGCSQMGLDNWIQEIITGAIIVAAVAIDRWRSFRSGGA